MTNPLNKHILFLSFYVNFLFSTLYQEQRHQRSQQRTRNGFGNCDRESPGTSERLRNLLSRLRDRVHSTFGTPQPSQTKRCFPHLFRTKRPPTTVRDEAPCESTECPTMGYHEFTSSTESEEEVDWRDEDREMLREINEMIAEIRSR